MYAQWNTRQENLCSFQQKTNLTGKYNTFFFVVSHFRSIYDLIVTYTNDVPYQGTAKTKSQY